MFYGDGYYLANPLKVFALGEGGMSFHGGLVGAVVGGAIMCRACHISIATFCDLGVIGAPLGLFFGRCANFVNGERVTPASCTRPCSRASSSLPCCCG